MDNPMSLEDRVIVVTGAAQGVGRGVAQKAAALGATLALIDINEEGAQETAALIGGNTTVHAGSVADAAFVQDAIAAIVEKHGRINGLFNNAGIGTPPVGLEDLTLEQWQACVDVNLTGVFLCTQQAIRIISRLASEQCGKVMERSEQDLER